MGVENVKIVLMSTVGRRYFTQTPHFSRGKKRFFYFKFQAKQVSLTTQSIVRASFINSREDMRSL